MNQKMVIVTVIVLLLLIVIIGLVMFGSSFVA